MRSDLCIYVVNMCATYDRFGLEDMSTHARVHLSGRGRADAGLADHGVDLGYGLLPPTGRHHLTKTSGL